MGGSAMAAALAAQAAAQRQRRMEAEMASRRERRRAQRMLAHADEELHTHDRHGFPCAAACLGCGYLALPSTKGDPMRRESTAIAVPDGKCSACGGKAFADLASVDTALAVREYERREIALRGGIVIHLLGTIAGIAAGAGAIAATMAGPFEGLLAVSVVFMAGGFAMYTGRRVWAGLTTPVRLASRWRAPLRAWRLGEPIGRGVATGDRALRAPISGRTVIAWRVEVRYPGDRDDACALLEQECAQIAIAGVPMDAEPIIATKATTLEAEGEEAREYLLSRGIDPHDILEICERVVVEGAAVEVHAERARPLAVLVDAAVA